MYKHLVAEAVKAKANVDARHAEAVNDVLSLHDTPVVPASDGVVARLQQNKRQLHDDLMATFQKDLQSINSEYDVIITKLSQQLYAALEERGRGSECTCIYIMLASTQSWKDLEAQEAYMVDIKAVQGYVR